MLNVLAFNVLHKIFPFTVKFEPIEQLAQLNDKAHCPNVDVISPVMPILIS